MKLYNKTKCPDAILEPLLVRAGRQIGVRTGGVIVKVTAGRSAACRGQAFECSWVYVWHLRNLKSRRNGRAIETDCGYFALSLPAPLVLGGASSDALKCAETFSSVARHEWGHIKDYQHGGTERLDWSKKTAAGRCAPHDLRPEEKRANRYSREAAEKIEAGKLQTADDDILALAIWMEENVKPPNPKVNQ